MKPYFQVQLTSNQWHQLFLDMMKSPSSISGLHADFCHYQQDNIVIPATSSHPLTNNCYVVSPLTLLTGCAKDEVPKIKARWLQKLSLGLIKGLMPVLKSARLDKVQTLNNQCLSTNMYSQQWYNLNIALLRKQAIQRYPDLPLVLRSLNEIQHQPIIHHLKQDNWVPLVTRQVYLHSDWQSFSFNRDLIKDFKLLNQPGWRFQPLTTPEEFARAHSLYNKLYLDKYSTNNIHFSVEYLQDATQRGLLKLIGLFYQDQMLATLGMVIVDSQMTCPIFGYDTSKAQSMALYRRISAYSIKYAWDNQLQFNMSSGAPTFKTNRKAKACIEYSYVYIQHLPRFQRWVWRLTSWITTQFYQTLLTQLKL